MKKTSLILTTLLLSLATTTNAQKWTAGYRTGASQDNFQFNDQFAQGGNLMWNNQVFVDRRLGKHLELELSLGYSQLSNAVSFPYFDEPTIILHQSWQTKFLSTTLSIRYYILQERKWEVFGLAGISSIKTWSRYERRYSGNLPTPNPPYTTYPSYAPYEGKDENNWPIASTFNAGIGLNHKLTQHLQLSSLFQLSYKGSAQSFFGSTVNQSDFSPALFVGIGYRF